MKTSTKLALVFFLVHTLLVLAFALWAWSWRDDGERQLGVWALLLHTVDLPLLPLFSNDFIQRLFGLLPNGFQLYAAILFAALAGGPIYAGVGWLIGYLGAKHRWQVSLRGMFLLVMISAVLVAVWRLVLVR
jgi:hypothetical protein